MYIPYIHTHRGDSCSDLWYHFLVIWIHCGIGTDKVGCSNLTLLCYIQYSTNKNLTSFIKWVNVWVLSFEF